MEDNKSGKKLRKQPDPITCRDDKVVNVIPRGDNRKIPKKEGVCYRREYVWQGPEMNVRETREERVSLPRNVPRRQRHVC